MTPSAKRSLRRSVAWPRTCSGDMYANLPLSTPTCVREARDAEVAELHFTFERDDHVLRRHVAVDDLEVLARGVLLLVRVLERVADTRGDVASLGDLHRLLDLLVVVEDLPEIASGDVLHRD